MSDRSDTHRGHFFGGPHDGEVYDLIPFAPTVRFPGNVEDSVRYVRDDGLPGRAFPEVIYHHAATMGSTVEGECRDHIFRYAMTRPARAPESSRTHHGMED